MLQLHQTLEKSGSLSGTVRTVQGILTEGVPADMRVMVTDCMNARHTANTTECVICTSAFTAKDLLSSANYERCRHTLYPCGHSATCGKCAKQLWETTQRCPLCRRQVTKKPRIFRPGRQQCTMMVDGIDAGSITWWRLLWYFLWLSCSCLEPFPPMEKGGSTSASWLFISESRDLD